MSSNEKNTWIHRTNVTASRICEFVDAECADEGFYPRSRKHVARVVTEYLTYWHSRKSYHRISRDVWVHPENFYFGKGDGLQPCSFCKPDED